VGTQLHVSFVQRLKSDFSEKLFLAIAVLHDP
jgi:hypothetical protein